MNVPTMSLLCLYLIFSCHISVAKDLPDPPDAIPSSAYGMSESHIKPC